MRLLQMIQRLASAARLLRVNDGTRIQMIQVEILGGEIRNVARLQDYGITSVPLPDAEGIALSLNGQRGRTVVIKMDDGRYRPVDLQPGDTCLYTNEGTVVHLQKGRKVLVDAASEVTVRSADIVMDGPVRCLGTLTVAKLIKGEQGLAIAGGTANINGATIGTDGNLVTKQGNSSDGHRHNYGGSPTTPPIPS